MHDNDQDRIPAREARAGGEDRQPAGHAGGQRRAGDLLTSSLTCKLTSHIAGVPGGQAEEGPEASQGAAEGRAQRGGEHTDRGHQQHHHAPAQAAGQLKKCIKNIDI